MPQIPFEKMPDLHIERETRSFTMSAMHYHNTYELYYLVSGEREYFIGDEFYRITDGDIVFIPPLLLHRTAGKGALRFLVSFSDAFFSRFFTEEAKAALSLDRPLVLRPNHAVREELEQKLADMLAAYGEAPDAEAILAGHLYRILFTLFRAKNDYVGEAHADARIVQIVRFINEHYCSIKDIDEIAEHFFISKFHLCRLFNKSLGLSLVTYLNAIKIHAACELMHRENLNLTEIATRCGFNSSSYFCKVFKSEKGLSPTAYRKSLSPK